LTGKENECVKDKKYLFESCSRQEAEAVDMKKKIAAS